eukprot:5328428-Pyramimonas_sp.AAC.1
MLMHAPADSSAATGTERRVARWLNAQSDAACRAIASALATYSKAFASFRLLRRAHVRCVA